MKKYIVLSIKEIIGAYKEIIRLYRKPIVIVITKDKYRFTFKPNLRLDFLDVKEGEDYFITKQHVQRIKSIMQDIRKADVIIVGCDAGISRSPAVAAAIAYLLNDWHEYTSLLVKYPFMNKDVKDFIIANMADVV